MNDDYSWPRCPHAAEALEARFRAFAAANPRVAEMEARFLDTAGVRLINLIDHWTLPESDAVRQELSHLGFEPTEVDESVCFRHPHARLPRVRLSAEISSPRMALGVEDIRHFAEANDLPSSGQYGDPDSGYEEARYPLTNGELAVIVRQGYAGFQPGELNAGQSRALDRVRLALRERSRDGGDGRALADVRTLMNSILDEIGPERATDEFFAVERAYYTARNRAAQWQYERQQSVGIGWANHDHHTYRCARGAFRGLITLWHALGFVSRERYYAGQDAGWGAQILEHPVSRVVLFCDVDMASEEVGIDFANADLPARDSLGTIGLWCALHGSSIGKAGMHHLECEFDYARAAANFEAHGFGVMPPFTDLPMLKQAFTKAETWQPAPERIAALQAHELITGEQAERFLAHGAPGSHLEILQRWEGFKGFNKTGVSQIIRATDARGDAAPEPRGSVKAGVE